MIPPRHEPAGPIDGALEEMKARRPVVVVVEVVFDWPGIGAMFVDAIGTRDFPVIQATVGLVAVTVLLANFVVDLLYGVVDPRIRIDASNR